MRRIEIMATLLLVFLLCACGSSERPTESQPAGETALPAGTVESAPVNAAGIRLNGTYWIHVGGYDWGPAVDRVVLTMEGALDAVSKEDFTVTEFKSATDYTQDGTPVTEQNFVRIVNDAYFSDAEGNRISEASENITLDLVVSPSEGSPINYDPNTGLNSWCDPYYLSIQMAAGSGLTAHGMEVGTLYINTSATKMITDADEFAVDSFTSGDAVTYQYAHYEPEGGSDTTLVWLHGGGEGGSGSHTDARIPLLASRAAVLMSEGFQSAVGGVNVLVPQCPTLWMDMNGGGRVADILSVSDGTSFYTESLHQLIDNYRQTTGSENVILAGCSNGGFMSLVMAQTYPGEYAGIIPICETLRDELITDEMLGTLKNLPMYFIYSNNDPVALPGVNSVPTLDWLNALSPSALHASVSDHVTDTSGAYFREDGSPYEYSGHWSWVYFFNNKTSCAYHGDTAWGFIAELNS